MPQCCRPVAARVSLGLGGRGGVSPAQGQPTLAEHVAWRRGSGDTCADGHDADRSECQPGTRGAEAKL